jgi:hypothetical protein
MADAAAGVEAKLFGKWSFDDVEVRILRLQDLGLLLGLPRG